MMRFRLRTLLLLLSGLCVYMGYECDWIIRKCRENRIEYIDLRPVFEKAGYAQIRIRDDDFCHPNQLGHRLAAEAIFRYCKDKNLRFIR